MAGFRIPGSSTQQSSYGFGTPSYSPPPSSFPNTGYEPVVADSRPYSDAGKLPLNILDMNAQAEDKPATGDTGGFFTGLFGALGGTFGEPGRQVGEAIGHVAEVPLGWLGGPVGAIGGVGIPFANEITGAMGAGLEAAGITQHGQKAPTIISDVVEPFTQGRVTVGGLFQSTLVSFGLLGRAVERAYAGTDFRGALPEDIEALIASGEITREEGIDRSVVRGQGFTDNPYVNIGLSILLDPLTWLTVGVGAVGKGVAATEKAAMSAERLGVIAKGAPRMTAARASEFLAKRGEFIARGDDPLLRVSRLEAFGLHSAGTLSTLEDQSTFVRIANQVTRLTDPLKFFGGGNIGKRTSEHVEAASLLGTMAAYKVPVVTTVRSLAEKVAPGAGERFDRAFAIFNVNMLNRALIDEMTGDTVRSIGKDRDAIVPFTTGEGGVALTPLQLTKATLDARGIDASFGTKVEMLVERVKPTLAGLSDSDVAAQTYAKMAKITGATPEAVVSAMGKVDYDTAALVHAVYYADLGRELVDELVPKLESVRDTLPKDIPNPSRLTLVGERTLTQTRRDEIKALIASKASVSDLRKAVAKIENFDFINEKVIKDEDLFDVVARYLEDNGDTALTEIPLRDAATGLIRADLPTDLARWMEEADQNGYRLALAPPEDLAPQKLFRITRDAEGRILTVNPWLPFISEHNAMKMPGRIQARQMAMFRQIRSERIVWTNRRRFIRSVVANHGVSQDLANRLFRSIVYAGNERSIAPRGLSPDEIFDAAKRALNEAEARGEQGLGTLTQRTLVNEVMVAFKGDFSQVGVTQAITGGAKKNLPGASGNFWGQLSENVYPKIKFVLSPWFLMQEYVEPYVLGAMRGINTPLRVDSPGFRQALATRNAINQFLQSDLGTEGALMEMAEYQKLLSGVAYEIHNGVSRGRLDKMTDQVWGKIAIRKEAAAALQTKQVFGQRFRQVVVDLKGQQAWTDMGRHFDTIDDGEIAMRWMSENFALRDANGERIGAIVDMLNPVNIGAETKIARGTGPGVRFHHLASYLGRTGEDADEVLIKSLKDGYDAHLKGIDPPDGAMTWEDFSALAAEKNLPDAFVKRAYFMATGPEVKDFWDAWSHAFYQRTVKGPKAKADSVAMMRALTQIRAVGMGMSEEEFIKTHFAGIPIRDVANTKVAQKTLLQQADTLFEARVGVVDDIRARLRPEHADLFDAGATETVSTKVWAKAGRLLAGRIEAPSAFQVRQAMGELLPIDAYTEQVPVSVLRGLIKENREAFPKVGPGATDLDELTADIAARGVQSPITLRYDPVRHAVMIDDGNHRVAVANRLGLGSLPATVISTGSTPRHHMSLVRLEGPSLSASKNERLLPSQIGLSTDVSPVRVVDPYASRLVPDLPDDVAAERYSMYLSVTDPERVRALATSRQLKPGESKTLLDRLDKIEKVRGRGRFVFTDPKTGAQFVAGNVTPEDLRDMALAWMPEAEGLAAKRWYPELKDHIYRLFGEDAPHVMRAFAVSQASDSPVNGMMMVLRAYEDMFARGIKPTQRNVGNMVRKYIGADLRPGSTLQLNAENITRVLLGGNINREFAAKLNDFLDSVSGNSSRRWIGRPVGVAPVAVDRHTARDVGFLDTKFLGNLVDLPTTTHIETALGTVHTIMDDGGQMVARVRKAKIGTGKKAEKEGWALVDEQGQFVDREGIVSTKPVSAGEFTGAPTDVQYELGSDVINRAVELFNRERVFGQNDWDAASIQALGWMRVQKTLGGMQENPMDVLRSQMQVVASEVGGTVNAGSDWGRFSRVFSDMLPEQTRSMTARVNTRVVGMIREKFGIATVHDNHVAPARWKGGDRTYSAPSVLFSTPESGDDVADILAYAYRQEQVWNPHFVATNKFTFGTHHPVVDIVSPSADAKVAEAELSRLADTLDAPGATMYKDVQGRTVLRIIDMPEDGSQPFFARYKARGKPAGTKTGMVDREALDPRLDQAMRDSGLDPELFERNATHAEIYIAGPKKGAGGALDWEGHLEDTLGRLRGRGRPVDEGTLRGISDAATEEVDAYLRSDPGLSERYSQSLRGDDLLTEQRTGAVLGYTRKLDDNRVILAGLKNSDPVTGLHEFAHVFAMDLDESARRMVMGARKTVYDEASGTTAARIAELEEKRSGVVAGAVPPTPAEQRVMIDDANAAARRDFTPTGGRTQASELEFEAGEIRIFNGDVAAKAAVVRAAAPDRATGAARFKLIDMNPDFGLRHGTTTTPSNQLVLTWDEMVPILKSEYGFTDEQLAAVAPVTPHRVPTAAEKAQISTEIGALQGELGSIATEDQWGKVHEEWFVSEFMKWMRTGKPQNAKLAPVFDHFRNWIGKVWETVKKHSGNATPNENVSPQMEALFNEMFSGRQPGVTVSYDLDQHVLRTAAKQQLMQAQDEAFTTQYFKKGRSFFERSLNHPYIGLYPISYMWGKVLPELFRFLALRPFGVTAPMVAWNALREVSDSVRLQQQTDPGFKKWMKDNAEFFLVLNSIFPALPSDVSVNAPLMMRRVAEQGLENAALAKQGQPVRDVDLGKGLADSAQYAFGFAFSMKQAMTGLETIGDLGRSAIGMEQPGAKKKKVAATAPLGLVP